MRAGFVSIIPVGIYVAARLIISCFIEYYRHLVYWDVFLGGVILLFIGMYLRGHNLIQAKLKAKDRGAEHKQKMNDIQSRGISTRRPPIP